MAKREIKWVHWSPSIEEHNTERSSNLGDRIIRDAVNSQIEKLFGERHSFLFSTKQTLGRAELESIYKSDLVVVGGSNLLSSHMFPTPLGKPVGNIYRQWKLRHFGTDYGQINTVLMGCGWWVYQAAPDFFTKRLLKSVLKGKEQGALHSVRDEYTLQKLQACGINNVVNTGCVTMWDLHGVSDDEVGKIDVRTAVCTLTDYRRNPETDARWLNLVRSYYDRVVVWPQGSKDLEYIRSLGLDGIDILEGEEIRYTELLSENVDYIGTRLHGGVRALQNRCQALILGVDNRAFEISKDTGLFVIDRENTAAIERWLEGDRKFRIKMPVDNIERWKMATLALCGK